MEAPPRTDLRDQHVPGPDGAAQALGGSREPASAAAAGETAAVDRPLGAYAVLVGVFTALFVVPLAVASRRRALPSRPQLADLALLGVGTFKLSRLLATDAVTGFVRAPFVRFEGMEGLTTPKESPRGHGLRRAIGQLLLCPKCMGLWLAAALTTGLTVAPRATRTACGALAVAAANDALQTAHKASTEAASGA